MARRGEILLVHLAEHGFRDVMNDRVVGRSSFASYKLGLHYLWAVLSREGFGCRVLDQTLDPFTLEDLVASCARDRPAAVGFYTSHEHREAVTVALRALRAAHPGLPLLCGGPDAFSDRHYLDAGADAVVIGEGEVTLPELLRAIASHAPLATVNGISYLGPDGAEVRTPPRAPIEDLDAIPFPHLTREIVAKNRIFSSVSGLRQVPILASRGCPFRCAFCASPALWGRLRMRSVENVMAELDEGRLRHGMTRAWFLDDLFGWQRPWLEEFVAAMRRRPRISWSCNLHPLSFGWDPEEVLADLAEIGLVRVSMGLQSIEPPAQRLMHRAPAEPARLTRLVAAARRAGVTTTVQLIFGMPSDTPETFERAYRYLVDVRPHTIETFALTLLSGSEFDGRPPTRPALSPEEIDRLMARLNRRFYLHPAIALVNARRLMRVDPIFALRHAPRIAWRFLRG